MTEGDTPAWRRRSAGKSTGRAAAQVAWTGPLLPQLKRYRRLSAAAYRLGAIALGGDVLLIVARGRAGFGWQWIAILVGLVIAGGVGLLLGRAAAREAEKLQQEMDQIEDEARRHLPT